MLTKNRLPLLVALICCTEILIYLWAVWTSTFDGDNFFAIQPEFIFDKCARNAGRVSSAIFLIALLMVGYVGLRKIYADEKKRESFLVLMTLFSVNHLIHLMYVIIRFRSHGKTIPLTGPLEIAGPAHGIITFAGIVLIPLVLWRYKQLSNVLYFVIIAYLLNNSSFIVKTFMSKVKPPDAPAYHNQFGMVVFTLVCFYILYRVYLENRRNVGADMAG